MCGTDIFLGILAIIFPPIAVWVKRGICSVDSLINIALCCLGFLPGLLHAWYIIVSYPDEYEQVSQDAEGGTVTYYYVASGPAPRQQQGYGTVNNQPNQQFPGQQSGVYFPKPQKTQQPQHPQGGSRSTPAPASAPAPAPAGEGPSNEASQPPPSYADVIKGDHKIQSDN